MKRNRLLLLVTLVVATVFLGACGEKKPAMQPGTDASVSPLDLFQKVWSSFGDDEKFPMAGGDFSKANMENPDVYDVAANKDSFISTFLVSEDMLSSITGDVVTGMHMMNSNTFCGAMFKLTDASKASDFAESYKKAVQGNQWMCGFPDTVVVLSCGDVIVIAYGEDSIIKSFKDKCTQADCKLIIEAPALEG